MALKKLLRRLVCRTVKENDEEAGLGNNKSDALIQQNKERETSPTRRPRSTSRSVKNKNRRAYEEKTPRIILELQERDLFTIRDAKSGKYLDIPRSFAPKPKWWMVVCKLVIFAWVAYVFVGEVYKTYPTGFYLATFDHWALTVTMIYLWFSFLCNALRKPSQSLDFPSNRYIPTLWHKITWTLFAIAAPSELFATLAFWIFEFQGRDVGDNLIVHLSIFVLLLLEGLFLNRTPVRINHHWFFFGFIYAFLFWSLIHSYTFIGNPTKERGMNSLYPFLNWESAPITTALNVVVILFIIAPIVYWIVWMLALFSFPCSFKGNNRRYLSQEESKPLESFVETEAS